MKGLLYFSCLMVVLLSCGKNNKNEYPEELNCEKYVGLYQMYDPENEVWYEMVIGDCYSGVLFGSTVWYSVPLINFGNRFSFSVGVGSQFLSSTIINPLLDKDGNRWNFGNVYYPDTLNRINVLVRDSIYLFFQIDNTAYWQEDSIPYQSITSVHSGVKIH